jgi:hypothetical protein
LRITDINLRETAKEEAAFDIVGGEGQGVAIGVGGFGKAVETPEEIGTGGGEKVKFGEFRALSEAVKEGQALFKGVAQSDGDGTIDFNDRGGINA